VQDKHSDAHRVHNKIIIGSVISHVQESRSYILPAPSCLCLAYGNCIIL